MVERTAPNPTGAAGASAFLTYLRGETLECTRRDGHIEYTTRGVVLSSLLALLPIVAVAAQAIQHTRTYVRAQQARLASS